MIFVNHIRLDLASHTIVADACVIPLSQQNMGKLSPALKRAELTGQWHVVIVTPDDETKLWKLLLPALAERCRTWKHLPTCEYLLQGIPACMDGLKLEASPLCSCGKGKDLGTFGTRPEWKEFHSEATRIALSPLFSFSFLNTMKADVENANIDSLKSLSSEASVSYAVCQLLWTWTAITSILQCLQTNDVLFSYVSKRVIGKPTSCTVRKPLLSDYVVLIVIDKFIAF